VRGARHAPHPLGPGPQAGRAGGVPGRDDPVGSGDEQERGGRDPGRVRGDVEGVAQEQAHGDKGMGVLSHGGEGIVGGDQDCPGYRPVGGDMGGQTAAEAAPHDHDGDIGAELFRQGVKGGQGIGLERRFRRLPPGTAIAPVIQAGHGVAGQLVRRPEEEGALFLGVAAKIQDRRGRSVVSPAGEEKAAQDRLVGDGDDKRLEPFVVVLDLFLPGRIGRPGGKDHAVLGQKKDGQIAAVGQGQGHDADGDDFHATYSSVETPAQLPAGRPLFQPPKGIPRPPVGTPREKPVGRPRLLPATVCAVLSVWGGSRNRDGHKALAAT